MVVNWVSGDKCFLCGKEVFSNSFNGLMVHTAIIIIDYPAIKAQKLFENTSFVAA